MDHLSVYKTNRRTARISRGHARINGSIETIIRYSNNKGLQTDIRREIRVELLKTYTGRDCGAS